MGIDDKIMDLQTIFKIAEKVFKSKEKAQEWMESKVPSLNHKIPREVVLTDPEGFEKVKQVLNAIEHGVYN